MHLIDNSSDAQARSCSSAQGLYTHSRSCHTNRVCRSSIRHDSPQQTTATAGEDESGADGGHSSSIEDALPGMLGILDEEECCSETTSCVSGNGDNQDRAMQQEDTLLDDLAMSRPSPGLQSAALYPSDDDDEGDITSSEEIFEDNAPISGKKSSQCTPLSNNGQDPLQSYGRSSNNMDDHNKSLFNTLERAFTANAKSGSTSRKSMSRRGSLIQATLTGIRNLLGDHTSSKATPGNTTTPTTNGGKLEQSTHTSSPLRRHSLAAAGTIGKNETEECESAVAQLADFLESRKRLAALAAQLNKCPTNPNLLESSGKHRSLGVGAMAGLGAGMDMAGANPLGNSGYKSPNVKSFLPRPAMPAPTPNRRASCAIIPTHHRTPLSGSSSSPNKPTPATISPERERSSLSHTPPYAGGSTKHGGYHQSHSRNRQIRGAGLGPVQQQIDATTVPTNYLRGDARIDHWCPTPSLGGSRRRASVATMMGEDSSPLRGGGVGGGAEASTPRIKHPAHHAPARSEKQSHSSTTACNRASRLPMMDSFSQTYVCLLDDKSTQTELTRLERLDRGTQTIEIQSSLVSRGCSTLE